MNSLEGAVADRLVARARQKRFYSKRDRAALALLLRSYALRIKSLEAASASLTSEVRIVKDGSVVRDWFFPSEVVVLQPGEIIDVRGWGGHLAELRKPSAVPLEAVSPLKERDH